MKTLFIPLIKKEKLNKLPLAKLPSTIYIVYAIQYKKIAQEAREELIKHGKKISGFSQVLGCTKLKSKHPFLLFADGSFHAENLLSQDNQVYLFDNYNLIKLNKQSDNNKGKLSKLYSANKLGILISTKPGQYNIKEAKKVKEKLKKQNKKAYLFLADNLNISELENFDIDFCLNTACPGLEKESNKIMNSVDIA